ncbi:hypothetical protein D3C86_1048520 [compost metagenome]
MRKAALPFVLLATSLTVACTSDFVGLAGARNANAKLSLVAAVQDGSFRTQAVLAPYTRSDIAHVTFKLYTASGSQETAVIRDGSPVELDVASGSLDLPFTFENLRNDTTYRVKASAYKAAGTAIADLISTQDASSSLDIAIGKDVTPPLQPVPVKLIDRLFAATGTTNLAVTDGAYTFKNERITVGPRTITITGSRNTWWSVDGGQTTYATGKTFRPVFDTSKLGTAVINGKTKYVVPTTFLNSTSDVIRIDDGNGFNTNGSWTGHYLGLMPNATGSLKLVVGDDSALNYTIYYP